MKQEATCSAGLVDAPEPLAVAVELQDGRVVQHQHLLVRKAPRPRPLGVRGVLGVPVAFLEGGLLAWEAEGLPIQR